MNRAALFVGIVSAALAVASSALAELTVDAEITARKVEVGESFRFQITALTDDGKVATPELRLPPGIASRGPDLGTRSQVSVTFGRMTRQTGISATWTLQASKPGKYTIGPATVTDGNQTKSTGTAVVEVVPQGTLDRAPKRRGGFFSQSPFDPFGGPSPFDRLFDRNLRDSRPQAPAEYQLDQAPDATAFVRAEVFPKQPVVGQQVTLRIYAYGARGPFNEASSSEATATDFLSYSILDRSPRLRFYEVPIDETIWYAAKIRETALFPLRAGDLTIGAMKVGFAGGRYSEAAVDAVIRHSDALTVRVVEPPKKGRPPGYELGNVGKFDLTATVQPRGVRVGDSISVVANLRGSGNLPRELKLPEQTGVEWLEPNITEELGFDDQGRYGGSRTLTYIVRLTKPGAHDLGQLELPYYDPQARRYRIARAKLGSVSVEGDAAPSAASATPPPIDESPLQALARSASHRSALSPYEPRGGTFSDEPAYWLGLAAGPLAVVGIAGAIGSVRRVRRRLTARRDSATSRTADELKRARSAADRDDPGEVARCLERAVFLVIEDRCGVKARGVLRERLTSELSEHGLAIDLAEEVRVTLDAIDALRFGQPSQGKTVVESTKRLVRKLQTAQVEVASEVRR